MARYSQQDKDRAMGALMASAVEGPDGEWVPNFRGVSDTLGISHQTLMRWWKTRDVSRDGPLRTATTRKRGELWEEGGQEWLDECWSQWRKAMGEVFAPEAWGGLSADKRARAVHLYRQAAQGSLVDMQHGDADARGGRGKLRRIRDAAIRAGLTKGKVT